MSVGGNRSPYRPPCGYSPEDAERYWLGGPWQHYVPAAAAVARLQNTTTVPNYNTDVGGGIPPYLAPNAETGELCGGTNQPVCGPWPEPVPANTYAPYSPGETVNLAACRKVGYKIVFARKAWHGRFGFTDTDGCCGFFGPQPAAGAAAQAKYLTLTFDISLHYTEEQPDVYVDGTYTLQGTVSVNRYSGVTTISGCAMTYTETDTPTGGGDSTTITHDVSDGSDAIANALIAACGQSCVSMASGDVAAHADGILNELCPGPAVGGSVTVDLSNTNFSVTYNATPYDPGDGYIATCTYTINATLSDPYTAAEVNADCDNLLGYWNLADDIQIPWRTDGNCTSGPLMTYLENTPAKPFPYTCGYADSSYAATTLAGYGVSSKILGAPLTSGSDPYFDFRFKNWRVYTLDDTSYYDISGWGGYAPSWAPNATQWTDLLDSSSLMPCAFAAYNSLYDQLTGGEDSGGLYYQGYLHKSKYAEVILLTAPSHDFDRPCGAKDAETVDQTSISCYNPDAPGSLRWPGCGNPCPDDGWNDNYPKGDWCLAEWTFDFRDAPGAVTGSWSGISLTQQCSTFVPCCPASVFISNNAEEGGNSQTFTIPALALDDCYGAQLNMAPMQWMTDPLWQVPAPPCAHYLDAGFEWLEDDGSGLADSPPIYYYPQRPWEECRTSVPGGAPALPSGCYLPALDVATINTAGSYAAAAASGQVIQPPTFGQCWMPWWTWAINRQNNIAAAGRFSCDYADPLAVCGDDTELAPP
jgi:hypothetical protein